MHHARAVARLDEVGDEHAVGAGVPGEEVERRLVGQTLQLAAGEGGDHVRLVAELALVGPQRIRSEQVPAPVLGDHRKMPA